MRVCFRVRQAIDGKISKFTNPTHRPFDPQQRIGWPSMVDGSLGGLGLSARARCVRRSGGGDRGGDRFRGTHHG